MSIFKNLNDSLKIQPQRNLHPGIRPNYTGLSSQLFWKVKARGSQVQGLPGLRSKSKSVWARWRVSLRRAKESWASASVLPSTRKALNSIPATVRENGGKEADYRNSLLWNCRGAEEINSSEVKSVCCSSKGSEFWSQRPWWVTHNHL